MDDIRNNVVKCSQPEARKAKRQLRDSDYFSEVVSYSPDDESSAVVYRSENDFLVTVVYGENEAAVDHLSRGTPDNEAAQEFVYEVVGQIEGVNDDFQREIEDEVFGTPKAVADGGRDMPEQGVYLEPPDGQTLEEVAELVRTDPPGFGVMVPEHRSDDLSGVAREQGDGVVATGEVADLLVRNGYDTPGGGDTHGEDRTGEVPVQEHSGFDAPGEE